MKVLFFLFLFLSFISNAQDQKFFFDQIFPIEQKLQEIEPGGVFDVHNLSAAQMQKAFALGGVILSPQGAQKMKQALTVWDNNNSSNASSVYNAFKSANIPISFAEAQILADHLTAGASKVGQNSHVFLITLIAKKTNAIFERLLKEAASPTKPNSPVSLSITRIVGRALRLQKMMLPKISGDDDWFENAYTSFGVSHTSFDDIAFNGSGKEDTFTLTLGGDIGADTSLSFGLSQTRSHRGGDSTQTYESFGGDIMIHHKFNEYIGAGIYAFYQDTDIHEYDSHAYGYGGGLLLSGFYDFGIVDVTMIHTFNKVWYKFGHDQIYVGSINLNRNWSDSFSTAVYARYTDSLKHDQIGDNSYWSVGGEVYYTVNDNISFSLGYERVVALEDYRSHTFNFNFIWSF